MESSFNQQSSHGIMADQQEDQDDDNDLDLVSSDVSSNNSIASSSLSDSMEDVTSSASSLGSSSSSDHLSSGSLYEMSSLFQQLPIKRGLSKHFQGKSQSFTSLSNVGCLEDLAKPENPYKKKLKSCKSYGGLSETHKSYPPKTCSRIISKKASRGSFSSLIGKRNSSFLGNRPPISPHRTSSLSNQSPFFA
ncbi:hypothetical protein HHK36_024121 [Tetracentron sinense]|uniref:Oxidative stress 3 n=1 Tax=Tetracentron sinense TaxID=13715 RepID=A0A834YP61_TETSI|nr:hypothetical protein HHK36_024121 [Tetracentron sinense]